MSKISSFIVWICSHFKRNEVEKINQELSKLLTDPNAKFGIKKDKFKEEHPNYRSFDADEVAPLVEKPKKKR